MKNKKAKIFKPTKTAMQSGKGNSKSWLLEFDTLNNTINPLMGWESSKDTMSEVKLFFDTEFDTFFSGRNYHQKYGIYGEYYVLGTSQ